jgi:outer membrane lipoprotein-sorting protein
MAQIQPTNPAGEGPDDDAVPGVPARRRKAVRYGVPVAVAGVAAATIGLVPALADSGAPDLPKITAEELVARMAASDVDQLSGTVRISTDLGLPALPSGLGGGQGGGSPFGGGDRTGGEGAPQDGEGGKESPAAPAGKLMELASGEHTLRVAADGPDKQRVSIVEDAAEYSLIRNGDELWAYDSKSNSAFHAVAPEGAGDHGKPGGEHGLPDGLADLTPEEAAEKALDLADESTSVTVDGTAKVAGRDAYQLVIAPKEAAHSTVGSLRIAVDAENGAPLQVRLMPDEGGKAIVDVAYTEVDFAKPDAGTFTFEPPEGADVTERKPDAGKKESGKPEGLEGTKNHAVPELTGGGLEMLGDGWGTVARIEPPKAADENGKAGKGLSGLDDLGDPRAQRMLDGFTDKVNGDFGSGRIFETRLVNALITDDGTVYVGAVTEEGLVEAANQAK